jgi:hypothetical protein
MKTIPTALVMQMISAESWNDEKDPDSDPDPDPDPVTDSDWTEKRKAE